MKKIVLCLVLAFIFTFNAKAGVSLGQFNIQSSFLESGKIKPNSGAETPFTVDFLISKAGEYYNTVKVTIIYQETNGTEIALSEPLWKYSGDWTTYIWEGHISAKLPTGKTTGKVYLKREVWDGDNSGGAFYSMTGYSIYTAPPPTGPDPKPIIGNPPSFVAPVSGAVPLYEYSWGYIRFLSTTYYSYYPNHSYEGVLGFVFTSATIGTVPLYEYYSHGNHYYTINQGTYGDYTYLGIACYVYANQITKTLPVYEHYLESSSGFHRYSNAPMSFSGFNFEGVKFYVLQNPQTTTFSLPEEDCAEVYQYYSAEYGNHYYTTVKKDHGGGYQFEKIVGYVSTIQKPGTVPLYVYYSGSDTDHYYTLVNQFYQNYKYEGILGYVYPNSGVSGTAPVYEYYNPSGTDHYYSMLNQTPVPYTSYGVKFYMLQYNH
jgi:hypothetical protein